MTDEDVVEIGNVENVCRLCLSADEPKSSVFTVQEQEDLVPLAAKIQTYLSIQISTTDKLSTLICASCVKNLNQWHTYKESCLRSQSKLQEWLESQSSKSSIEMVKDEPMDTMDGYDDKEKESVDDEIKSLLPNQTVEGNEINNKELKDVLNDDDGNANVTNEEKYSEVVPSVAKKETDKDGEGQTEDKRDSPIVCSIKSEPQDDYDTDDCTVELESNDSDVLLNSTEGAEKEDTVMEADSTQKSNAAGATQKKKLRRGPHTHFRGTRIFKKKCVYCQIFLHSKYSYVKHMKRFHSNKDNSAENSESQNEEEEMVEDLEDELISMEKDSSPLTQVQHDIISQLKTFSCYSCEETFNDRRSTLSHIRQHLPDLQPYTCIACLTKFSNRTLYQMHCGASFECAMKIALVVPKQGSERYFTCNMCLRSMQGRKELLNHLSQHSDKQYDETVSQTCSPPKLKPMTPLSTPKNDSSSKPLLSIKGGPYKNGDPAHNHMCDLCGMIYRYRSNMIKHKQLCARLQPEIRTSYKCFHCSMTFLVFKKFHSHITVIHRKKEFTCAICNSKFRSPSDFLSHHEKHRPAHSSKQMQHDSSDKTLQNTQSPLKERNASYGADGSSSKVKVDQKYNCALCNQEFSTRTELTEHRNLHLKVKIYSCAICRSMFSSSGALEIHMKDHGIEDPNERDANISCVEYGSLAEDVKIEDTGAANTSVVSDPGVHNECNQCGKVFSSYANLRRHATIAHRASKMYTCSECPKEFVRKDFYEQHVQLEHKSNKVVYKCQECPKSFTFAANFDYHFRTAHLEKSQNGYACDICGKVFSEEASLKIHKGWHNRANSRLSTRFILGNQKSPEDQSINSESPGNSERPARARKSFPGTPSQMKSSSGNYQCQVCKDTFNDVTELRTHLWDVHCAKNKPEKSFSSDELQCDLCTNVFPDRETLTSHMKWHKGNPILNDVQKTFPCDICGKSYSSKKVLWKHKRLHKATVVASIKFQSLVRRPMANQFLCTICRKVFCSNQSLQRHKLNFHSDLQGQQRTTQQFYSSTRRPLPEDEPKQKRQKVEDTNDNPPKLPPFAMNFTGERRKSVMCHVCKRMFPNMSVLYKHKQTVHKGRTGKDGVPECRPLATQDGKFSCNVCSKKFPGLSNLRQHFTIKHRKNVSVDQYQCNVSSCEQVFNTSDSLKDHEQTHTSIMFSCKLCDRYVFNKESMIDHIINVHNTVYQIDSKAFHREIDLNSYVVRGAVGATCPQCNVKYPNNRAMKIHYVKIHENTD